MNNMRKFSVHVIGVTLSVCLFLGNNYTCFAMETDRQTVKNEEAFEQQIIVGKETRKYYADNILQMSDTLPEKITLAFVGDMNLDESWPTTQYLNRQKNDIYSCISGDLIQEMKNADIFMPNNEFTYSLRGTKTPGKMYTFRANPDRVSVMQELGADIVLLANNHCHDYGADSLFDTLDTLERAGINYVGAGRNLQEAMTPFYFTYHGLIIAYVAASNAEVYRLTPQATATTPGILRCYDPSLFLEEIRAAKQNADLVIASIHWGKEGSNYVVPAQQQLGYQMIEAGADAIIGSHPHVLQGIEFYQGKPIMYSLGNFWFNAQTLYTCLYELEIDTETKSIDKVRFIPAVQQNCTTVRPNDFATQRKIYDFEEGLSFSVKIDDEGYVTPK